MTDSEPGSTRFAFGIEYDGSAYNGWQIQPHAPSVQSVLNAALSCVADRPTECTGAGRTDTGVHATGQVAHFDTQAQRPLRSWLLGLNANLPPDVNVLWIRPVSPDFHARFSATARSYRYLILNRAVRSALKRNSAWWICQPLDDALMSLAADYLVGEHDFSAFRAAACQSHSAVRTIRELTIRREGDVINIDCTANAFLHHMVRNLVGSLVRVGRGERDAVWLQEVLAGRNRTLAGMTAPACGLTLTHVEYPESVLAGQSMPAQ